MPYNDEVGPHETDKFLPWLAEKKHKVVSDPVLFMANLPKEYAPIYEHLTKLGFHDKPDYALCYGVIDEIAKEKNYSDSTPLDWETSSQLKAFIA